jgi:hypothetical protein
MRIYLPKDWTQVSVRQFQELTVCKERCEDQIDMIIEVLSIMSEKTRQEISTIEMKDVFKLWDGLKFIEQGMPDKVEQRLKLKGVSYYTDLNILKFNTDQYGSLKSYIKDGDIIGNLHKILSVFYVPVGEKYCEGKRSIEEIQDDMLDCPISVAYPIAVFFWNLLNAWMKIIEDSLLSQSETKLKSLSL